MSVFTSCDPSCSSIYLVGLPCIQYFSHAVQCFEYIQANIVVFIIVISTGADEGCFIESITLSALVVLNSYSGVSDYGWTLCDSQLIQQQSLEQHQTIELYEPR